MQINNQHSPNFGSLIITKEAKKLLPYAHQSVKEAVSEIGEQLKDTKKWDLELGVYDDLFMHRIIDKDKTKTYVKDLIYEGPVTTKPDTDIQVQRTQAHPRYSVGIEGWEFNSKEERDKARDTFLKYPYFPTNQTYAEALKECADKVLILDNVKRVYKIVNYC